MPRLKFQEPESEDDIPDERVMHSGPFQIPKNLHANLQKQNKVKFNSRNEIFLKTQVTKKKYFNFLNDNNKDERILK